ncbi:MAG: ABC transporter ATP-binding protein [Paracoccaceae bacterium]|nr:MAG: ABC transporter ATP-binding protein [Paracoccaceae bacterium]
MTHGRDLLRVEDLRVSFRLPHARIEALRGAALRVLPGRVTALVGESGSGKSVLSQCVMGLQPRAAEVSGRILFDDPLGSGAPVDLLSLPQDGRRMRAIRGRRIGMIFQEPMTSFSALHTIGNQISEVLRIHAPDSARAIRTRCEEMLALVGFSRPARVFDMYPFELSGGMRQRAMIAMALICDPALLIADEPTTALDVTIQAQILKLLRDLQERLGMAILLITHDLGVVANIADEVVVIYHGEIMEAGPVSPLFRSPRHAYLRGLMGAIPHFGMKPGDRLRPLRDIRPDREAFRAARPAAQAAPPRDLPADHAILRVEGLTKSFRIRKEGWFGKGASTVAKAVDGVGFTVRRGECLGLVGESGSGKTTVSKIIMRAVTPDAGSVIFDDGSGPVDVLRAEGPALHDLRTRIQMVFQDPVASLSPRMTVGGIIAEPMEIHRRLDGSGRKAAVSGLLRAVGLEPSAAARFPHSFSGGQRQRIGIARALALSPSLLVCDEPVSALDVSVQAQVLNLLKDLQKDLGLTTLFISHNLAVVDYMADRVAVMWAGRIVEIAPREVIMSAPVHPYTRALLAAVPFPDLDRPLDFACAGVASATASASWPAAFRDEGGDLAPADLGGGHQVLARRSADLRELVA